MVGSVKDLTYERLVEVLVYDPATGIFTWLARAVRSDNLRAGRSWNARYAGKRAGSLNKVLGYRMIDIDDNPYLEHRLAVLYVTGAWPEDQVDHKNTDKGSNPWENLRDADNSRNMMNRGPQVNNSLGLKGVSSVRGGFFARINYGGVSKYLGYFDDPYEAHAAYCAAAEKYHGEFARSR